MEKRKIFFIIALLFFLINFENVFAAHFIVGFVNNASDGKSANGQIVVLWNPNVGISDNVTDVIGQGGNSGNDNTFLIDCEMLNSPCNVGDEIKAFVMNNGENYTSFPINLSVTGAGFDLMDNLTLIKNAGFISLVVEDDFIVPEDEIDLNAGTTKKISCYSIYTDADSVGVHNVSSEFFEIVDSAQWEDDDNNVHYTNESCFLNYDYGDSTEIEVNCTYNIWYYAKNSNWECIVRGNKNVTNESVSLSDNTYVNSLVALGVPESLDYGIVNTSNVSGEKVLNVTNYGNVAFNLSLRGYAVEEGDNLSMNCSYGFNRNISIYYQRYNFSESNFYPELMNYSEFILNYTNLTSSYGVVRNFNIEERNSDSINDAILPVYMRIYVPSDVSGNCQGNLVFGALQHQGY